MSSRWSQTTNLSVVCGILAAIILWLPGAPLRAQVTSGTISGRVQDVTGAVISGASVTVSNPSNGLTRQITTSDSGEFVAPNLLPGTYNITVRRPASERWSLRGLC
jgi:hypothetical protein